MRIATSALVLLVLGACSSYPEEGQDPQSKTNLELEKLRAEMKQQNAVALLMCDKLTDANRGLIERLVKLEALVGVSQADLKVLMDQVKTLQDQVTAPTPPNPANPSNPAAAGPRKTTEDVLMDIEAAITGLSSGKLKKEEVAVQLKPHPAYAAPRLLEEIRRSPTRFEYVKQLEFVLSQLSPKELKVFLREALTTRGSRDSAARVIGMSKDSELGRLLEEHAGAPEEDFRLLCGDSLVACRNPAGLPLLVQCLKSPEGSTRTIAFASLKRANRGETFGYSAPLSPEQNAAAIKSWEDWTQKFGPTLFD
jgi:hypothetical protein